MRQRIGSSLVQIMACLFGAKPLPEPMLPYCQMDSYEHSLVNLNRNSIIFFQENATVNVVYQNGGHSIRRRWVKK